jgi:hypothetical protein
VRSHAKASSAGPIEGTGRAAPALRLLGVLTLAVAAFFAVTVGSASAGYKTNETGAIASEGSEDGQILKPGRADVEQATGNLFVVDSGNNRVQVFKPNGSEGADYLTQFGGGELSSPWGIAIDENAGQTYVYVADAGNNRIVKYASDEAPTPTFTVDGSFTSPEEGFYEEGKLNSFRAALAVDPTTHELLVADPGRNVVARFDPTGAPVVGDEIDGSQGPGSPGAFTGLIDVAVNSDGDVYVVDSTGNIGLGEGTSQVRRYSSAGLYKATLSPVGPDQRPATVAINGDDDSVAVSGQQDAVFRDQTPTFHLFDAANNPVQSFDLGGSSPASYNSVSGLAITDADGPLYVVFAPGLGYEEAYGSAHIERLEFVQAPGVGIEPPVESGLSLQVSGTVAPEGRATEYRFQIAVDDGSPSWQDFGGGATANATDSEEVSATRGDLDSETDYLVRLIATNGGGTTYSGVHSFATSVSAPTVRTIAGSERTTSTVRLIGLVNPHGNKTSYYFEYGPDASYGQRIPLSGGTDIGAGRQLLRVSHLLTGLQPGTTIHYRVVASSALGTATGADHEVSTTTADLGFELVSPPDKRGDQVAPVYIVQSSPDGERVAYASNGTFPGSVGSSARNYYIGSRTGSGWDTTPLSPPYYWPKGLIGGSLMAISSDLSKSVVFSRAALDEGAIKGHMNVYIFDNLYRTYDYVGGAADASLSAFGPFPAVAASKDFDHVVFTNRQYGGLFTPDTPPWNPTGAELIGTIFDVTGGAIEMVSYLGSGQTEPSDQDSLVGGISEDGSRIFFTGGIHSTGSYALFVREDGATTKAISVSQRSGDEGTVYGGVFGGATPDGSVVFFGSKARLTDDAPTDGAEVLYRYNLNTDELEAIGTGPTSTPVEISNGSVQGILPDGSGAYFSSTRALTPGATEGGRNSYFWSEGDGFKLIVTRPPDGFSGGGSPGEDGSIMSPNGRYLVFSTRDQLTDYSTVCQGPGGRCPMVYIYDSKESRLACVSCPPNGESSRDGASYGGGGLIKSVPYQPRAVFDDGRVYFNSVDSLVPEDQDGTSDVYLWQDGQTDLISKGTSLAATFADATADGKEVFFYTAQPMVGIDRDDNVDLYVARPGGGIAAQNPDAITPPCEGSACQATPSLNPPDLSPGSSGDVGGGNSSTTCSRLGLRAARATTQAKKVAQAASRAVGPDAKALKKKARRAKAKAKRAQKEAIRCR